MIDFIFTFLNFGFFLGIAVYYFRKKVVGLIKEELALKAASRRDLHNQETAASAEYRTLQEQLEYQKRLYTSLEKKLLVWQAAVNAKMEEEAQVRHQHEQKIHERLEKQHHYLEELATVARVVPAAFDSSMHNLKVYFADSKHCADYNRNILGFLNKQ